MAMFGEYNFDSVEFGEMLNEFFSAHNNNCILNHDRFENVQIKIEPFDMTKETETNKTDQLIVKRK